MTRLRRRRAVLLLSFAALALAAGAVALVLGPRRIVDGLRRRVGAARRAVEIEERCAPGPAGLRVCVASDMAKLPDHGPVPLERWLFDPGQRVVSLAAARDETVAFQVVLKGASAGAPARVALELSDLSGPGGARIAERDDLRRFLALYVNATPAGHTWGPKSEVLPWPERYPDALVPFRPRCRLTVSGALAAPRQLIETFTVRPGRNQAVWIDLHVPRGQRPGRYAGELRVRAGGRTQRLALRLRVHAATLPARPSLDAVGELYNPYRADGVGVRVDTAAWRRMSQCYQQLAHRHRVVLLERASDLRGLGPLRGDDEAGWRNFDAAFGPALSGALFTARYGYRGPGQGEPVGVFRAPWPQPYNGRLAGPLPEAEVARYEAAARSLARHLRRRGWTSSYLYAYIFDEIVGPTDEGGGEAADRDYLRLAHEQVRRVQAAIDRGAGPKTIDVMWTSHADPSRWEGVKELDLSPVVRLWVPNAGAARPSFLRRRVQDRDRVWFYHHGHPFIGLHVINASGIELRTWGLIAARYGLNGTFLWAANFGDPEQPFRRPTYKRRDDRFGNGTIVYPGAALPGVGLPALPEPLPSMRLKCWRRGLQDAELARLARRAGQGAAVDALLRRLIPRALAAGRGGAAWPSDPRVWHEARLQLLELAGRR